jgi:hypothetical protein
MDNAKVLIGRDCGRAPKLAGKLKKINVRKR